LETNIHNEHGNHSCSEIDGRASGPAGRIADAAMAPALDVGAKAVARLAAATRPFIIVGYGARRPACTSRPKVVWVGIEQGVRLVWPSSC